MKETIRWAIIGAGRAGQARARAIIADPRSVCVGGLRGDPAAAGIAVLSSLQEAIDAADAVAVCSPDATHPALVDRALRAGRHVVCEFPLAPTAAQAAALLAQASTQGVVLHTEHIELLSATARWWRERAPQVRGGILRFTSPRAAPRLALANVARLHRIVDILGLPERLRITQRRPGRLQGELSMAGGGSIAVDFQAGAGLRRQLDLTLDTERGVISQSGRGISIAGVPVPLLPAGGLFAADPDRAMRRICAGARGYVTDARVLAVLDLAARLDGAAVGVWLDGPAGG